jgi:hypothetical protein
MHIEKNVCENVIVAICGKKGRQGGEVRLGGAKHTPAPMAYMQPTKPNFGE